MKKRTRDLLIATGLIGCGTVGAVAFVIDRSQQPTTGSIIITNGEKTVSQQVEPNSQGRITIVQQPSYPVVNQSGYEIPPIHNDNTYTPNQNSTMPICAPEALKVGIKHFRYDDASPSDLVWSGYGSQNDSKYKIHRDAKPALQAMIQAAKADGVTLTVGSIFRSASRQAQIVNDKKAQGQSDRQIYFTSSHPGFSEHHTGLTLDFSPINSSFANTAGYRWLKQNAAKYGFEQTFTADYVAYSGVSEESWHWRYVGKNGEFEHIFADSKNRRC